MNQEYFYVIETTNENIFKFGKTKDIDRRMNQYKNGSCNCIIKNKIISYLTESGKGEEKNFYYFLAKNNIKKISKEKFMYEFDINELLKKYQKYREENIDFIISIRKDDLNNNNNRDLLFNYSKNFI